MSDIICNHLGISKDEFIQVIKEKNLTTLDEVLDETDAGSVCGTCIPEIEEILNDVLSGKL
ncbi:(2Fe-2S)-binding protein [Saccharicrinis sp. FJH54]|uniref:(2Fe-2S)-binding protein n=1 Tax=Saccharicrinis sp. FJH54 TaxID=3344665 RepID=UPI0035D45971